jgi:nucleoid DNA-binding protein|tara:strand:- start:520 stop:801 length:282 start_codon:yes stop_codon:yes gene_type:complete
LSKQKLIKQLQDKNPQLNQSEIENIINIFIKNTHEILKDGNNLEIRGFGRWYHKILKENFKARNPSTNKLIYKPERVKIRFRPFKKLKKLINE